jgi:hypothetical protein
MRFFPAGLRRTFLPSLSRPRRNASSHRRALRPQDRPHLERLEPRQVFAGSAIDPLLIVTATQPVIPSSSIDSTAPAVFRPGGSGSPLTPPPPPSPPPSSGDTYRVDTIADGYDGLLRERESFRVRVSRSVVGYPSPAAVGIWADTNFNGVRDDGEESVDQVIHGPDGFIEVKFQALDDGPARGNGTRSDIIPIEVSVNGAVIKNTGIEILNVPPVIPKPFGVYFFKTDDGPILDITAVFDDPGVAIDWVGWRPPQDNGDRHKLLIRPAGGAPVESGWFSASNGGSRLAEITFRFNNFPIDVDADSSYLEFELRDDDSGSAHYTHHFQRLNVNVDDDNRNGIPDDRDYDFEPGREFDDDIVRLNGEWSRNAELSLRPNGRVDLFYKPSHLRVWSGPDKQFLLEPYGGIPNLPNGVRLVAYQAWQRENPRAVPFVEGLGAAPVNRRNSPYDTDIYVVWSDPQPRNGLLDPTQRRELGPIVNRVYLQPRLDAAFIDFSDQGITQDSGAQYPDTHWADRNGDGDVTDRNEWSNAASFYPNKTGRVLQDGTALWRDHISGWVHFYFFGSDTAIEGRTSDLDYQVRLVHNDPFMRLEPVGETVAKHGLGDFFELPRVLPDRIDYGQLDITWTVDFSPVPHGYARRLLKPRDIVYVSSHTVFVTGNYAPLAYETPLVLGTVAARGLQPDTARGRELITSAIWDEFSDHSVRRVSDNVLMSLLLPTGLPDEPVTGFEAMLKDRAGQGNSRAWATLFRETLRYQGVSAEVWAVAPSLHDGFRRRSGPIQGGGLAPFTNYHRSYVVQVPGLERSAERVWDPAYGILVDSRLQWERIAVHCWWDFSLDRRSRYYSPYDYDLVRLQTFWMRDVS